MLLRVSTVDDYDLVFSGDPSLAAPAESATELEHKAWSEKMERARHTGVWGSDMFHPGAEPTVFTMRHIVGSTKRRLQDMVGGGEIGQAEALALAFRVAVKSVKNLGAQPTQVKREQHPRLGDVAAQSLADLLDDISPAIVTELGLVVVERMRRGPSPL